MVSQRQTDYGKYARIVNIGKPRVRLPDLQTQKETLCCRFGYYLLWPGSFSRL